MFVSGLLINECQILALLISSFLSTLDAAQWFSHMWFLRRWFLCDPKKFLYFKDIEVFSFSCTVGRDLDKDTRVWLVKSFCQVKNSLSSLRLCVWHLKAACSVSTVDKWGAETWNRDDQPHVQLHVIATKKPELGEEINKDGSIYQSINQSCLRFSTDQKEQIKLIRKYIIYHFFLFCFYKKLHVWIQTLCLLKSLRWYKF